MDNLADLPPKNDTVKTPEEEQIMSQFFADVEEDASLQKEGGSFFSRIKLKHVGIATLLFVALANPWVDQLFCKVPYCGENKFSLLGIKTIVFFMLILILFTFM